MAMKSLSLIVETVKQRLSEKLRNMRKSKKENDRKQTDTPLTGNVESERSGVAMDSERERSITELLEQMIGLQQESNTYALESLSQQRDIKRLQREANELLESISEALVTPATEVQISQIGDSMITGPGTSGTFQATPNGAVQPNTYGFTTDDPNASITPSSDGSTAVIQASAGNTATSLTVTVKVTSSDAAGTVLTSSLTVPFSAPPPTPATSVSLAQIA
jgi:hypothetical protein